LGQYTHGLSNRCPPMPGGENEPQTAGAMRAVQQGRLYPRRQQVLVEPHRRGSGQRGQALVREQAATRLQAAGPELGAEEPDTLRQEVAQGVTYALVERQGMLRGVEVRG
jgi:hypothetical protein